MNNKKKTNRPILDRFFLRTKNYTNLKILKNKFFVNVSFYIFSYNLVFEVIHKEKIIKVNLF